MFPIARPSSSTPPERSTPLLIDPTQRAASSSLAAPAYNLTSSSRGSALSCGATARECEEVDARWSSRSESSRSRVRYESSCGGGWCSGSRSAGGAARRAASEHSGQLPARRMTLPRSRSGTVEGRARTAVEDGVPPGLADVEPAEAHPADAVSSPRVLAAPDLVPPARVDLLAALGAAPDALDRPCGLVLVPEGVAGCPLGLGLREEGG